MIQFLSSLRFAFKGVSLLITIFVGIFYLIFPTLLTNFNLMLLTISDSSPLLFKIQFLFLLFSGAILYLPFLELFFSLLTALLLGINMSLIIQSIRLMAKQKSVSMSVGGSSIIAIVGTGCASCGISLLSVLGISSAFLPFHGLDLVIISAILLLISLIIILKNKDIVCRLA